MLLFLSRLLRSKSGSAEIVAFVMILPFLLLPIVNSVYMTTDLAIQNKILLATRKSLLEMEAAGGMTSDIYNSLTTRLNEQGVTLSKLTINATPAPVSYGSTVSIEVIYNKPLVRFKLEGLFLKRQEDNTGIKIGPLTAISKYYVR